MWEIEGVVMYKSMAPDRVDHYIWHLPFMTVKKELDVMSEDVDPTLVVSRIFFQLNVTSILYVAQVFYPYISLILYDPFFNAQLMHELSGLI